MPPRPAPTRETPQQLMARMVAEAVAVALAERDNSIHTNNGTGDSSAGCSYKTFMGCKPHSFNGTEGPVGLTRWFEKMEAVFSISGCRDQDKVKYSTHTFGDSALTWWNTFVNSVTAEEAHALSWAGLKEKMTSEYFSRVEVRRLEDELRNLKVVENDLKSFDQKFSELSLMCPKLVTPEINRVELYIDGLPKSIRNSVISSKPKTQQEALTMAHDLMANVTETEAPTPATKVDSGKRKWEGNQSGGSNDYQGKKPFVPHGKQPITGQTSFCNKCHRHHNGQCNNLFCDRCHRKGHSANECRSKTPIAPRGKDAQGTIVCYRCGQPGHFSKTCPNKKANPNARG